MENDKFDEAQEGMYKLMYTVTWHVVIINYSVALVKAEKQDEAIKLLARLTENAINENRYSSNHQPQE